MRGEIRWSVRGGVRKGAHGFKWWFTLIELLVVVAIITILLSLLLPALRAARQKTQGIACVNNLKQVGTSIIMYAGDEEGWSPHAYNSAYPVARRTWAGLLSDLKYIPRIPPFLSPSHGTMLSCPSMKGENGNHIYGVRSHGQVCGVGFRVLHSPVTWAYGSSSASWRNPSAFIMAGDTRSSNSDVQWYILDDNNWGGGRPVAHTRHFHKGNFVCADGHAEGIAGNDLIANYPSGYGFNAFISQKGVGYGVGF